MGKQASKTSEFRLLESEQLPEVIARREADPRSWSTEPATTCLEGQDEMEEDSFDRPYVVDEHSIATTSTG